MNIPNIITSVRILGTLLLLFVTPFSREFFIIYTLAGISDALDGFVARMTKTATEFGAQLDSVADILFYLVMIYKSLFVLSGDLSVITWCIIGFAVIVRIVSYVYSARKYRRFVPLHTYMNKVTGFAVFILPYLTFFGFFNEACFAASVIAAVAAVEELLIHIKKQVDPAPMPNSSKVQQ